MPVNEYGQMIGEPMEGYTPGELPFIDFLEGRYARIPEIGRSNRVFLLYPWSIQGSAFRISQIGRAHV